CGCKPALAECSTDKDCLGRVWSVKCYGSWDCVDWTCHEACGEPCGDDKCDPAAGEDSSNCPSDCPLDPCGLALNPQCAPEACTDVSGKPGFCGALFAGCGCRVGTAQCAADLDCVALAWNVDCIGHWDCLDKTCKPVCGKPCGDKFCDPKAGESASSCAIDCSPIGI
ncbi:MAG: hypothetical protein FJ087_20875, partial [Deltaproteobacteria bacterium]|nr:hypothetical protein [Deltaproteobacteria bacterium]